MARVLRVWATGEFGTRCTRPLAPAQNLSPATRVDSTARMCVETVLQWSAALLGAQGMRAPLCVEPRNTRPTGLPLACRIESLSKMKLVRSGTRATGLRRCELPSWAKRVVYSSPAAASAAAATGRQCYAANVAGFGGLIQQVGRLGHGKAYRMKCTHILASSLVHSCTKPGAAAIVLACKHIHGLRWIWSMWCYLVCRMAMRVWLCAAARL